MLQEQGHSEDTHNEPQDEEETDLHDRAEQLTAIGIVATGNGTQHHHHDNGQDILEDKHRHDKPRKLLLAET